MNGRSEPRQKSTDTASQPGFQLPATNFTFSLHEEATHDQNIHLRTEEAIERFFGPADDWLIFVKGSVEHEGDACLKVEIRN